MTRVLVAGVGNVFLSDDGFGVEVARRLAGRDLPAGVEVADIGIRGMHLAYRLLDGYRVLVLVDTVRQGHPPGTLSLLEHDLDGPSDEAARFDAHGMDPGAVLTMLDQLAHGVGVERPVDRVLVVGCEPASVDEGSDCPNWWPRSSTGRRRRSSTWSATCSMRRIKMIVAAGGRDRGGGRRLPPRRLTRSDTARSARCRAGKHVPGDPRRDRRDPRRSRGSGDGQRRGRQACGEHRSAGGRDARPRRLDPHPRRLRPLQDRRTRGEGVPGMADRGR